MSLEAESSSSSIPWFDYQRSGLIDPLAVEPGKEQLQQPTNGWCLGGGGFGVNNPLDPRLRYGPDPVNPVMESKDLQQKANLQHVLVILNSFCKNGTNVWERIVEPALAEASVTFTVVQTERQGHARDYCQKLDTTTTPMMMTMDGVVVDAILVVGGDGTLNEVVHGLMTRQGGGDDDGDAIPPIGLVPAGTGNSTAESLGSVDPKVWMKTILHSKAYTKIDLGMVVYGKEKQVRYMHQFLGWGIGVDANVRAEKMRWLGVARYDLGALLEIMACKQRNVKVKITCDDGEHELAGDYLLIMMHNVAYAGASMRLLPYAKIDDGYLDVLLAKNEGRKGQLDYFAEIKRNGCHVYSELTSYYRCTKIELDCPGDEEPSLLVLDGENCAHTPISLTVVPKALPFFVPLASNTSS